MSEINLDRLREATGHLRDALRQLREIGSASESAFLAGVRTLNGAKYLLIVAAEAALDICNHLAARRGGRSPEDYADCMTVMAELGVIGPALRDRLARMVRFETSLFTSTVVSTTSGCTG